MRWRLHLHPPSLEMERSALRLSDSVDPSLLVLSVPDYLADGGEAVECFALPLMLRDGGVLLALPTSIILSGLLLPDELIEASEIVGPSKIFQASVYEEDDEGTVQLVSENARVLVCDFLDSILQFCREYDPVTDSTAPIRGFLPESPLAIPLHHELTEAAASWARSETTGRVNFYSAREEPPQTPKANAAKKGAAKRMTNAAISEQLSALAAQVKILAERQAHMTVQPAPSGLATSANPAGGQLPSLSGGPKMPAVSAGFGAGGPAHPAKALALVGPPPKVRAPLLTAAAPDEPYDPLDPGMDPTAIALTQQSAAITTLVQHLVHGGDGLGLEVGASSGLSSSSTRGTQKREKLQQDLAARSSQFFMMVQQQIFRKMYPSRIIPKTEEDLANSGVSMLTYLERYGGYRGQREAGLTMWLLAHAMDCSAASDIHGAKEYLALLTMAMEQSVFDAGDWSIAYILSLVEDPPTVMFSDRMQSITASGRPFSPLVPAQLAAINLAYIKELEVLQSRRGEVPSKNRKGANKTADGEDQVESPSPKRKPRFPRKPKGGDVPAS